jgi:DNA-binding MarR family transcriptional regulator
MAQESEDRAQQSLLLFEQLFQLLRPLEALLETDLTLAQMRVFVLLAKGEPMIVGQLARKLNVSHPTAAHLLACLVEAGLVQRGEDTEDRRRTWCRLTPRGHALYDRLLMKKQALYDRLRKMDEADLVALLQGLQALLRGEDHHA